MRHRPVFLLLLLGGFSHVLSLRSGKWCFAACELNVNYLDFNDTELGLPKKIRSCRSKLGAASLYLCMHEYCEGQGRHEWFHDGNAKCLRLANETLPPYDIISDYTPDEIAAVRRLGADEGLDFPMLGEVVIPDEPFFERAFTTLVAAYFQVDIHWVYGWTLYYFWLCVIALGIGIRLVSLISSMRERKWQPVPEDDSSLEQQHPAKQPGYSSLPHTLLKRFIIFPATFGYRCAQNVGWCTIPPRVQTLTITLFIILNMVACSASYYVTDGNLYWPNKSIQLCRYISDRTGIVSLANFPLIWLFGTRNNTLMWLTGWGFGAYNNFHRWAARVATLQAVVHSIGYALMIYEYGGWSDIWRYSRKHYFWNGELATLFMCALLAFSVYGLRRSHYEIFLVTHIVFSIIVLWTMYYHVEIFTDGEWNIFIWPCLAIWIFDRSLRFIRMFAFDWRFWSTRATATYDPSSNLVTMNVPCPRTLYKPQPGTYYYVYVLDSLLYAHQNHPFTLAYISSERHPGSHHQMQSSPLPSRRSPSRSSSLESAESDGLLDYSAPSSSLTFLIRPYNGFTSRLAKQCCVHPKSLHVLIEGPYGHTIPLRTFPNILFVIGGTGIAVPLSHLASLLSAESSVTSLRIIWAVREHKFFVSILRDFRALLSDERVSLQVHVTRDEEAKDDDGTADEIKGVEIAAGRPDVDVAVGDAVLEAAGARLAVVACGPGQMADQARRASVRALAGGCGDVEYFEESFKW